MCQGNRSRDTPATQVGFIFTNGDWFVLLSAVDALPVMSGLARRGWGCFVRGGWLIMLGGGFLS